MSMNIFLRITGGIGNQLFQLFKAYEISKNVTGNKPKIYVCSQFQNDFFRRRSSHESDKRSFSLETLGLITGDIYHLEKVNLLTHMIFKFRLVKLLSRSNVLRLRATYLDGYYIENSHHINALDYFAPQIQNLVSVASADVCGLHVRAGDLLRQPQNQLCDDRYYHRAINYMRSEADLRAIHVYTEDIEYAKSLLPDLSGFEVKFFSGNEIVDFLGLCSYRYLICANSTYSWMAGALGYSKKFISTEYFYKIGDRPQKLSKEVIIGFQDKLTNK